MQAFTYIVSDLTEFESEPVDMEMETDEEAVLYEKGPAPAALFETAT